MKLLATLAAASLTLLAGCGTSAGLPAPTSFQNTALQAASTQATASGLVLTSVTSRVDVPSPMPGHLMPIAITATFVGSDAQGDFTIVVKTNNPDGGLFVPELVSATRNGDAIPEDQWNAVGNALWEATLSLHGVNGDALSATLALRMAAR